jgi:hypothetical protein
MPLHSGRKGATSRSPSLSVAPVLDQLCDVGKHSRDVAQTVGMGNCTDAHVAEHECAHIVARKKEGLHFSIFSSDRTKGYMSTAKEELHKAHRDAHQKYTYFLLAAAGAAIGFAVTQTRTAALSPSQVILALAVGSWGISFYCGCKQLLETSNLIRQNYEFLRMQNGELQRFSPLPELVKEIAKSIEKQVEESGKWGVWQFRLLILGAVFYIAWHVVEMYLRTA